MRLLGLDLDPIPYIPQCQLDEDNATVFWLKPKTVELIQKDIRTMDFKDIPNFHLYATNQKLAEFLAVCVKVENFQFDKEEKITEEVITIEGLVKVFNQTDPNLIREVLDYCTTSSVLSSAHRQAIELMTYFALTKNEDMSLQDRLSYDCENCQVAKKHEERYCFVLNPMNVIEMPVLGEQDDFTMEYDVFPDTKKTAFIAEEFLTEFFEIAKKLYPTVPAYLSLLRLQGYLNWSKEVCVTGLIDRDLIQLLDWASDCKNMSALPYPGEYFKQPNQLIEGFKAVNTTISEYERVKLKVSHKGKRAEKEG